MGKWLWIVAALLLGLPGCGDDTPTRANTFTPLTSLVVEADLETLAHGTSTRLVARGNFSGLFTRDITSQVVWSSDQPGIVDFDVPGRVKANELTGVATITATSVEGITGSFPLTVTAADIATVTVTSPATTLPVGLTQAFTAQGTFSDATTQDLTFDALWVSSAENFATVSNDDASKGVVTGVNQGITTISATFDGVSDSTPLTVTAPIPLAITVTPASSSLLGLTSQRFTAKGTFSDNTTPDITTYVTWASANTAVATVAADGTVNALVPGTTTIKATLDGVSGSATLKVTGGNLASIALNLAPANNNVLIKDTLSRITARGTFSNGTSRDITSAVTFAVDSTNVSVTPVSGNLAWVQALGITPSSTPTKISASYGSVVPAGERLLTVIAPTLNVAGLSIPEQTLTLASDSSGRLSLTGAFSSGRQDLTATAEWFSASPAIATVGNIGLDKGRVAALAAGTAVITATYGGQSATTTVTVVARTLESLTIAAVTAPATFMTGTEKKFKVTARYTDGSEQDVTADAIWTIENSSIARFSDQLSEPGLIVAVDAGTTTLTANFGAQVDTETLTVSQ